MTTYFTEDHEWITVNGGTATVGITDYAQAQLGDIVFVELPAAGANVAKGGEAAASELIATSALQQTLHLAGYWDGPIDGQWTPELTEALQQLQTDLGVEPTGVVDAATVAAFDDALAGLVDPAEPTQDPTPSEEPEPTVEPTTEPEPSATE